METPLTERLAVHAEQLENMRSGRTPSRPIGEVGLGFLIHDIDEAIEALRSKTN